MRFHEIHAVTQQPFKIRCVGGETATVEQNKVTWDKSGSLVSAVSAATWDWELVIEPTVESVLRERGYEFRLDGHAICQWYGGDRPYIVFKEDKRPTTVAQVNAICDFLDQYR